MFAVVINMLAIILGGFIGVFLHKGIPQQTKNTIMQGVGLAIVIIGAKMALASENDVVVIIALVLGGIVGEWLHLDQKMDALAYWIKDRFHVQANNFVDGFVSASLIFCIGAMAIVGSIEAALDHNYTVLLVKSTLDGIIAIVLASSLGIGVVFSGGAVFVYQGILCLLAGILQPILTESIIGYMSALGGILIVAIGLSTAEIKQFNTVNL